MVPEECWLNNFREREIPDFGNLISSSLPFATVPIDVNDTRGVEVLVDLLQHGIAGRNHYYYHWNPPYYHSIPGSIPGLMVRESVARKLSTINLELQRGGLELFVFDAYRPISVQNYFFFHWVPNYLRMQHPEKNEEWIAQETERYWARGARSREDLMRQIPPHSTGAAVDLTLRHIETHQLLEMGSIFDDVTERSHIDFFELRNGQGISGFTEREAMRNRRVLFHLMKNAGFAVHPREWWHYSYGDQLWAMLTEQAAAFYGYAGPVAGERLFADE